MCYTEWNAWILTALSASLVGPTLAITWPQEVLNEEENLAVAAQVHGDVREHRAKVVNHP